MLLYECKFIYFAFPEIFRTCKDTCRIFRILIIWRNIEFETVLLRKNIDAFGEANEGTAAPLSNLSLIADRCVCGLIIITLAPRCPARGTSRDQRNPQRRWSCRCFITLRNARPRRKKAEEVGGSRWCDGGLFRATQFYVSSSASAISACSINRGGAREKENWRQKSRSRVLEKEFVRVS